MYITFPLKLRQKGGSFSSTPPPACQSCRKRKVRCGRELPSCQACVRRGKGDFCSYLTNVGQSPPWEPCRIPKQLCSIEPHTSKGFLGEKAPNACIHKTSCLASQTLSPALASSSRKEQASPSAHPNRLGSVNTHSPGKPGSPVAVNAYQSDRGNNQFDERLPSPSPPATTPYSQLELSPSLPPPPGHSLLGLISACGESPPTFYQLLVVLNYVFVSAMLPEDDAAMWRIIYRRPADWERAFVLQYDGLLLWLISTRNALIKPCHLQTVSLGDLVSQIRWILFLLGGQALSGSSFLQTCFQSDKCPYRPFGARASIALICLAFTGLQPEDITNYNSRDMWPCGEQYYNLMASILSQSPVFEGDVGVSQLKTMILSLHEAFQLEDERVAFTMPQEIYYDNGSSTYEYYRQAFLSLDPRLLPKICHLLCPSGLPVDDSAPNLASMCAQAFRVAPSVDALEATFASIPGIANSQADRTVVIEMLDVRLFQQLGQPF